jgi:predicted nucleic acid-binding protein
VKRIFLDANIFFSAAHSPSGGSSLILKLARKEIFEIWTVRQALQEAEKNLIQKSTPGALWRHRQNILFLDLKIQPLPEDKIGSFTALSKILPSKDLPILLGALFSNTEVLVTLDKKHFLKNSQLKIFPFKILNPEFFLKLFL